MSPNGTYIVCWTIHEDHWVIAHSMEEAKRIYTAAIEQPECYCAGIAALVEGTDWEPHPAFAAGAQS